jgi:hypothetical protein
VNTERCYREKRKIGGERGINAPAQDIVSHWFFKVLNIRTIQFRLEMSP